MATFETACIIPGFRKHDQLRQVFGRREVHVGIFDSDDADKLLAMPPCPVKLVVETMASTPAEDIQGLRERFGDAVQ